MSDRGERLPYVAFGNDELREAATLGEGDGVACAHCGGRHRVEAARVTQSTDPARVGETGLMFYRCGDDTYLAGLDGKNVMHLFGEGA